MTFYPVASGNLAGVFSARPATGAFVGQAFETENGGRFVWDGTLWRPSLGGVLGYAPPLAATWAAVNAPVSITDDNGALNVLGSLDGGTVILRSYTRPRTFGSTVEIAIALRDTGQAGASSIFFGIGLGVRRSANARSLVCGMAFNQGTNEMAINVATWTDDNTRSAFVETDFPTDPTEPYFLRQRTDGVNLIPEFSRDRNLWETVAGSQNVAAFFGGAPDLVSIATFGTNGQARATVTHFVQDPPN